MKLDGMDDVNIMNNNIYTFWLRRFFGATSASGIFKCVVSAEYIVIDFQQPLIIPLEDIEECRVESGGGPTGRLSFVRLKLLNQKDDVFMTTWNPLNSKLIFHQSHSDDIALTSVINSLKYQKEVFYDTNPYKRELILRHISKYDGFKFDPTLSPNYYEEIFYPKISRRRLIVRITITVFFVIALFFLLSLLFGGFRVVVNL